MKHTQFKKELNEIRRRAIQELKEALAAHNGKHEWDEDEDLPTMNDGGRLLNVSLTQDGDFVAWILYDGDYEEAWDERTASIDEILQITDAIPLTDEMNDVSGVYPMPVTWVDRDDIENAGYDASNLTQSDLDNIANHMCGSYLNYGFSEDLQNACESYGLKGKED